MKTKEEVLENKFKERGIRKGWIGESKEAVLEAMEDYADEKLRLYHVGRQSEEILCVYCLDTGKYNTFAGVNKCPNPKCKTNLK